MSTQSTGPRSDAGKQRSSANAATHGLCSERPVLPIEDPAAWDAFHDGVVQELDPVGIFETELADRIALQLWRLRRVARFEATVGTDLYEETAGKAAGAMIGLSPNDPNWQAMLQAHRDTDEANEGLASAEAAQSLVAQLPTMPDDTVMDPTVVLLLVQLPGRRVDHRGEAADDRGAPAAGPAGGLEEAVARDARLLDPRLRGTLPGDDGGRSPPGTSASRRSWKTWRCTWKPCGTITRSCKSRSWIGWCVTKPTSAVNCGTLRRHWRNSRRNVRLRSRCQPRLPPHDSPQFVR